jgi:hypothetical protein
VDPEFNFFVGKKILAGTADVGWRDPGIACAKQTDPTPRLRNLSDLVKGSHLQFPCSCATLHSLLKITVMLTPTEAEQSHTISPIHICVLKFISHVCYFSVYIIKVLSTCILNNDLHITKICHWYIYVKLQSLLLYTHHFWAFPVIWAKWFGQCVYITAITATYTHRPTI